MEVIIFLQSMNHDKCHQFQVMNDRPASLVNLLPYLLEFRTRVDYDGLVYTRVLATKSHAQR